MHDFMKSVSIIVCALDIVYLPLIVLAVLLIYLQLLKSYQPNTRYIARIAVVYVVTRILLIGFNEGRNQKKF